MTDSKQAVHSANLSIVRARVFLGVMLALGALAIGGSASATGSVAASSASAFGVRVTVPGKGAVTAGSISSPPQAIASLVGWTHSSDAVTVGEIDAGTRATVDDGRGIGRAAASAASVSLFGGELTADSVNVSAVSHASATAAGGRFSDSTLTNVVVLGQGVAAAANTRVTLGDWGYAVLLEQAVVRQNTSTRRGHRGFVTGIHVHLTADHGGLPAGTEIYIGYAEAAATATKTAPPDPSPLPQPPPPPHHQVPPPSPQPPPSSVIHPTPTDVHPQLTANGYVFPVYGPSSFSNDFGAPRADTAWHHGNDIFAPVGAPILAVADGTLFLVGWNPIGGNRFWLRDMQGNEFYFAHLSAFSPLAHDGAHVHAGDVIGFVGHTGDAEGTPPHLHFEIHPVELLWKGYDGVVNPYPYLLAWRQQADVSFSASGWAPAGGKAPPAAAVLLEADDISTMSGLDPGAYSTLLDVGPLFGEGPPGPKIVEATPGFGG
jgi:murein DD-endopeptidase MepM/ murein hydrolase activator NlpD